MRRFRFFITESKNSLNIGATFGRFAQGATKEHEKLIDKVLKGPFDFL